MPDATYIIIKAIRQQLKTAHRENMPVYIHAPMGYGKTEAVRHYYDRGSVLWLTGISGSLMRQNALFQTARRNALSETDADTPDILPSPVEIKEDTVVADDISWVTDTKSRKWLQQMVRSKVKNLVLIGRSKMPDWISEEYLSGMLMTADESTLVFGEDETQRMAQILGVQCDGCPLDANIISRITSDCLGIPLLIKTMLLELIRSQEYDRERLFKSVLEQYYTVFETKAFGRWRQDMQHLLLCMADFPSFDREMATALSLRQNVPAILEYALQIGDVLQMDGRGNYQMQVFLREFLHWKRRLVWTEEEKDLHNRAALYFQMKRQLPEALKQCSLAGNRKRAVAILEQNAEENTDKRYFFDTRDFYLNLSEQEIENSPALMSGLSILYSICRLPGDSERLYRKLQEYRDSRTLTQEEKMSVQGWLCRLDIILPHRGDISLIHVLKKTADCIRSGEAILWPFSVTDGLPGILNGGKDLSRWMKHDRELAGILKEPLRVVLGRNAAGIVDIALAESIFEKAAGDDYDVISLAESGIEKADRLGETENCFAGIGVLVKLHVSHRQMHLAKRILMDMEQKTMREKEPQILPNLHAMRAWLSLLEGDSDSIEKWMETEPGGNFAFCTLDRYCYLIRLRCYIALERYDEAWSLAARLIPYLEEYGRTILWVQVKLLQAILCFRTGREQWKEHFRNALDKAGEYGLVWTMAQEGAAISALLEKTELDRGDSFAALFQKKQKQMAAQYPRYLGRNHAAPEPLTAKELEILRLLCEGFTTTEMLERLKVTGSTLKFHNSNIYRKLGVKNRQEAVYAARKLKLI